VQIDERQRRMVFERYPIDMSTYVTLRDGLSVDTRRYWVRLIQLLRNSHGCSSNAECDQCCDAGLVTALELDGWQVEVPP